MVILIMFGYILPVVGMWFYLHVAYSKKGIWSDLEPEDTDLILLLCPILNLFCMFAWIFEPPIKTKMTWLKKFFKVK